MDPENEVTAQPEVIPGDAELPVDDGAPADESPDTGSDDASTDAAAEPEELVVTIGDDAPEVAESEDEIDTSGLTPKATAAFIRLRQQKRDLARQVKQLQERPATAQKPTEEIVLGPKPTLANPTGNEEDAYDEAKFETALEDWHKRKGEVDKLNEQRKQAQQAQQDAWNQSLATYEKSKAALKVPDFIDAESTIKDTFSVMQQGIIVSGAKNSAVLIYALGKNPKRAKELAAISDPIKFAFAAADLENQLKVTSRKPAPAPERQLSGAAPVAVGGSDAHLERLRAEAQKTGDLTKVNAYKRQMRAKQAA